MTLHTIDAGYFKLDGGAMFGVVPKQLWERQIPADSLNLCNWAMRCLLIEDGKRLILIDTGMGDKQPEKWLRHYYRSGEYTLLSSLKSKGFSQYDVTDVILSHLHFDHAGGAVCWDSTKSNFELTFPNANYWTQSSHWNWAMQPNQREAATFLTENIVPIKEHGNLKFIDAENNPLGDNINFLLADGHTEKMIMPIISYKDKKVVFVADTIPSHAHIHIPYVMGYDVRPLKTMNEKEVLLTKAVEENWILFFDHDPYYSCATIEKVNHKFQPKQLGNLNEFL